MQCVVVRERRMTSDEVEGELAKRDARAEGAEGRAVDSESALEQARRECEWAKDAAARAREELAAKHRQMVRRRTRLRDACDPSAMGDTYMHASCMCRRTDFVGWSCLLRRDQSCSRCGRMCKADR